MKNFLKETGRALLYPLIYLGSQVFVSFWVALVFIVAAVVEMFKNPDMEEVIEMMTAALLNNSALIMLISCAFAFLLIWIIKRKEWKQENFWKGAKFSGLTGILCVASSVVIYFFITGFVEITRLAEIFTDHDELMELAMGNNIIIEILAIGLLGPFLEEIIFRGIILRRFLKTNMKVLLAIFLQALLFGIIHLNILQGLYAFMIGIIFGLIYYWCRSIWLPVIMHALFNSISVILSNLSPESVLMEALNNLSYGAFVIITVVSAIVLTGLIYFIYNQEKSKIELKEIITDHE